MNEQPIDILISILRKKSVKIVLALIFVLIVIWAIAARLMQPPVLTAYATSLTLSDSVKIEGTTTKVYNGNSFYTIDLVNNNAKKVIFTPEYRLPEVSTIAWAGEKGVLLNFKSSVMYTPVYDYFVEHNLDITSDDYATWYLDFSTGKLSLVDENILQDDTAHYSKKDNGFYYVPDLAFSETDVDRNVLSFYSLESNTSTVVVDDFNVSVQSMKDCDQPNGTICIVGRKNAEAYGKYYVFSTSKATKKLSTVYTHQGELYETPLQDTYILLSEPTDYQGTSTLYKKITTLNIKTNQKRDYPGNVFGGSVVVGVENNKIYIIDGHNNEVVWLNDGVFNGSSSVGSITSDKSYGLDDGISIVPSQQGNKVLIASVSGNTYALSTEKLTLPTAVSTEKSEELIGECLTQKSKIYTTSERNYTILIEDDDSFSETLKKLKLCIANNPDNLVGYTYTYKGFSSVNGRISTD